MLKKYRLQPWPKGRYRRYRALKSCYRNAALLAMRHQGELELVKGYAKDGFGLWVGHWWCADREGGVVDPSWKNEGVTYVGVEVVDVKAYVARSIESGGWEREIHAIAPPEIRERLEALDES
jgi:hypothetical protein